MFIATAIRRPQAPEERDKSAGRSAPTELRQGKQPSVYKHFIPTGIGVSTKL